MQIPDIFELDRKLKDLVRSERKITHEILTHINHIEYAAGYAKLGYSSMFAYLTQCLGYSEDSAYRRLSAARLMRDQPKIAEKLKSGSITLSQAAQIQKSLKVSEKITSAKVSTSAASTLIEKIETLNLFKTKRVLAKELDLPMIQEASIRPQSDDSVRIEVTLTREQFEKLEKAKAALSHKVPGQEWARVIEELCDQSLNLAAKKQGVMKLHAAAPLLEQPRCEYKTPDGHVCKSGYQVQVDHRKPKARGGSDEKNNLRLLCRTHNLLEARRWGLMRPTEIALNPPLAFGAAIAT